MLLSLYKTLFQYLIIPAILTGICVSDAFSFSRSHSLCEIVQGKNEHTCVYKCIGVCMHVCINSHAYLVYILTKVLFHHVAYMKRRQRHIYWHVKYYLWQRDGSRARCMLSCGQPPWFDLWYHVVSQVHHYMQLWSWSGQGIL